MPTNATQKLRGKPIADAMRKEIQGRIEFLSAKGIQPTLAALLIQGDAAAAAYARSKQRAAEKLGISCRMRELPEQASLQDVLNVIETWNSDPSIHGIMVELPLPQHIDTGVVVDSILPAKDIDGLTPANRLATMTASPGIYPATPLACIALLKAYGYPLVGRNVVLVGRGKTVGMPLLHLLLRENATVTVCHSYTQDVGQHLRSADYAFVAIGRAGFVKPEMVHPDLVLIDAGINEKPDGQIVGDVDESVNGRVRALTPTPGGVGPITTLQLFLNLLDAIDFSFAPSHT